MRYACPFFLGPNHAVAVEPVPRCVGPDNPPKYERTTYGAFTQHLLTLNFMRRFTSGPKASHPPITVRRLT